MKKTVFVDMDGVLADFDAHFERTFGKPFKAFRYEDRWDLINAYPNFFQDLPMMRGAKQWWGSICRYCKESGFRLAILTSLPHTNMEKTAAQKMSWVRNTLSDPNVMVIFSRGGTRKSMFVQQAGDILIDDKQLNLLAWEANGGKGVLFEPGSKLQL